jgi:hypothetical protein
VADRFDSQPERDMLNCCEEALSACGVVTNSHHRSVTLEIGCGARNQRYLQLWSGAA